MNVRELIQQMDLTVVNEGDLSRPVTGGYMGDLLSWVMGRAQQNDAWITIMSNLNTIAVAVLADVSAVLLAEGVTADDAALKKAREEGVTLLQSSKSAFQLAGELYALLQGDGQ